MIADLTASFVPAQHEWFQQALNGSSDFAGYFVWAKPSAYNDSLPMPPNNWVTTTVNQLQKFAVWLNLNFLRVLAHCIRFLFGENASR